MANKDIDQLQLRKSHKGRVSRNIWLISMAVSVLSLVVMYISYINSFTGIFLITLIVSAVVGAIFFWIWIFKIGNKFIKFVLIFLLVLGLMSILFLRSAMVNGSLMEPFIKDGEYLLFNKFTYLTSLPQRGDVVIYVLESSAEQKVGRIIGLPGEILLIKQGEIKIDGNILDEPHADWSRWPYKEKQLVLKEDEYFIYYDKRIGVPITESGIFFPVKIKNIIGKFFYRYWPLSSSGFIVN